MRLSDTFAHLENNIDEGLANLVEHVKKITNRSLENKVYKKVRQPFILGKTKCIRT